MQAALVTMNPTELDRAARMQRTAQAEVARQLGVGLRQVERMYAAYKLGGAGSLASKRRGRPNNRRPSAVYRDAVLELVRANYADFGPTLAREKLIERHGVAPSVETRSQSRDRNRCRDRGPRRVPTGARIGEHC